MNNIIALLITFGLALLWLRINNYTAKRGWVSSDLSRKLIHTGTGPLFVVCWLLFNEDASARYLAALVPFAITAQFILVGTGIMKDESAVKSMSRSGDRREILRGPLLYGIVFIILTIVFWYETPIGIIALMLLCGGDGLADILGRRFGKIRLPWNPNKSIIGSAGMFLGGLVTAAIVLAIFIAAGKFEGPFLAYLLPMVIIAAAGTLVESLPFHDIDNVTVALTAVLLGTYFFKM